MDSLSSILPRVLHKRGLHGHAMAAMVTHRALAWLRAALPHCIDQLRVESLTDGVLMISARHPIAAQECMPLLPSLTDYLRRECKGCSLREVRVVRVRSQKGAQGAQDPLPQP